MSQIKKQSRKYLANCFGQMSKLGLNHPLNSPVTVLSKSKESHWL